MGHLETFNLKFLKALKRSLKLERERQRQRQRQTETETEIQRQRAQPEAPTSRNCGAESIMDQIGPAKVQFVASP